MWVSCVENYILGSVNHLIPPVHLHNIVSNLSRCSFPRAGHLSRLPPFAEYGHRHGCARNWTGLFGADLSDLR